MSLYGKLRYGAAEISEHFDDPYWWRHRITNRLVGPINSNFYPGKSDAIDLMVESWDNLIVLDGCRADLFESVVDVETYDEYRRVKSAGSKTPEWAVENFGDDEFGDTVYLSSNGWITEVLDQPFHEMIEVWKEVDGVVHPSDMTEHARRAARNHPHKRLIIHYLQPHRPFVSSDGRFGEEINDNPWGALARNEVSPGSIWEEYADNLRTVMSDVDDLLSELEGRTVITSDHGNAMGERAPLLPVRVYGHPGGVRSSSLVEVPWAVIDGDRKEIQDDGVGEGVTRSEDEVRENLEDLGYLE